MSAFTSATYIQAHSIDFFVESNNMNPDQTAPNCLQYRLPENISRCAADNKSCDWQAMLLVVKNLKGIYTIKCLVCFSLSFIGDTSRALI